MAATPHSPRPLPCLALGLVALLAAPAAAQIFKCTDNAGNVVYQNAACPKNTKAGRVDIFDNSWTADRAEKDAAWQRQATEHRVVGGMPQRWVREALGEPEEVRKTATAGADEVWLYNFPDRSAQVGMLANHVLWFRETPVPVPPARVEASLPPLPPRVDVPAPEPPARVEAPPPAEAPAPAAAARAGAPAPAAPARVDASPPTAPARVATVPDSSATQTPRPAVDAPRDAPESARSAPLTPKVSESKHGIARGQDCKQALAELGTPDREREVPPPDKESDAVTEYFYEPAGSASPTRTRIVCAHGKVEGVDRSVVR